jgi:hypothetical protein
MKVGERVIVDAAVTGDGIHHHGFIEDIYDFARTSFIDVHFDEPTPWGVLGTTVTNPGLIRKEAEA